MHGFFGSVGICCCHSDIYTSWRRRGNKCECVSEYCISDCDILAVDCSVPILSIQYPAVRVKRVGRIGGICGDMRGDDGICGVNLSIKSISSIAYHPHHDPKIF